MKFNKIVYKVYFSHSFALSKIYLVPQTLLWVTFVQFFNKTFTPKSRSILRNIGEQLFEIEFPFLFW